jgi:hypothetical protein
MDIEHHSLEMDGLHWRLVTSKPKDAARPSQGMNFQT